MSADMLRLWHTVRYLKPVQVYGRIWHHLHRPRVVGQPAPPLRRATGRASVAFVARPATMLGSATFRFLNVTETPTWPEGWTAATADRLWLYNLHYFDALMAVDAKRHLAAHRDLIARWIGDNPIGRGIGWDPYPTSLRIVNWIKWRLHNTVLGRRQRAAASLDAAMADSLAAQARWLAGSIEWHLSGNHLLANAKALCWAGLYFSGPEAEGWLARGLAIYARELPDQILADGGHVERSPMYHAIVLEDLLDLLNLAQFHTGVISATTLMQWRSTALRMCAWLAAMAHPDGRIAFFNDAAFGIAAEPAMLWAYAARLGLTPALAINAPLHVLSSSGYIRMTGGGLAAIVDVAAIGPDHQPGHGHADTLSFELSLGAERIIVNGGTSVYGSNEQRQRQRGTAAHSTVEIDGEDSSQVWSGFRVGRRARVRDLTIEATTDAATVTAAHDGYLRLAGKPMHQRQWRLGGGGMVISDRIIGRARSAIARFHLHPDIMVSVAGSGLSGTLRTKAGASLAWRATAPARLEPSLWHPEFGRTMTTTCLAIPIADGSASFSIDSP